jgi:hypothetical protein
MSLHYRARKLFPVLALSILASWSLTALAEEGRCLIIHVPQESADGFNQALNIANNLPKQLGADAARVYVIAQGPGLKLLTRAALRPNASRVWPRRQTRPWAVVPSSSPARQPSPASRRGRARSRNSLKGSR